MTNPRAPGLRDRLAAIATLLVFRVGLRLVSFERLRRLAALGAGAVVDRNTAEHTAASVLWAASVLPGRSSCLAQALAASRLLGRRHIRNRLVLGVGREAVGHRFHAWVECDDAIVIGAADAAGCSRLAAFE
jgi:hypothetical protein